MASEHILVSAIAPGLFAIATKRDLFLAAVDDAFDRMEQAFALARGFDLGHRAPRRRADAVAEDDGDPIVAIGQAYGRLLGDDPAALRLHLHALAVAGDSQVGPR